MDVRSHGNVENVRVSALKPYDRNARTHSAHQVKQLAEAMRTFGFTNPLLITVDSMVVAGHGRLEAARSLGMQEVPCIRLAGLSDAQVRALIISDNKLGLNSGWDDKLLAEELQAIQFMVDAGDLDIDMDIVGFSAPEMDELMQLLVDPEPDGEPTDITVEPEPAVSRIGETWLLGAHRLTIGGASVPRDADAIIRLWERETKEEAKLAGNGETFAGRAKALGIEFVRPAVKSQKARRSA